MAFPRLKLTGIKNLFTEANMIFVGVLFLAIVFLALVAVDAYLFYTVRKREAAVSSPSAPAAVLTSQEIDQAIKLIDQRNQEYQALLNAK